MAEWKSAKLATGVSVPYLEQGDPKATTVLLLHAYAQSGIYWTPLLERLPPSLHAVAPTARGHGAADKPSSGYSQDDMARDVLALMDELAVERAVLVGQSSGGYLARAIAERAPRRVQGLVLLASPLNLQGRRAPFADRVDQLQDPVTDADILDIARPFDAHLEVSDALQEETKENRRRMPARVWQQTLTGLAMAPKPLPAVRHIPALVIHGSADPVITLTEQHRLAAHLHDAELKVYKGVGHTTLWERPQRVADDLLAFLARIGATPDQAQKE